MSSHWQRDHAGTENSDLIGANIEIEKERKFASFLPCSESSTWVWCVPWLDECEAHDCGCGVHGSRFSGKAGGFITGFSSVTGVGGASFLGGILSFIASRPFASANEVILWFGEKPWRAVNNNSIVEQCNFRTMGIKNYTVLYVVLFNSFIILSTAFVWSIAYRFLATFCHPITHQEAKLQWAWGPSIVTHSRFPLWKIKTNYNDKQIVLKKKRRRKNRSKKKCFSSILH